MLKSIACRTLFIALLPLALPACAIQTPPAPLDPDTMAAQFNQRDLSDQGLVYYLQQTLGYVPTKWNIDTLTRVAFYFSPALDAARKRLTVASINEQIEQQRPNPAVSLPLQYTLSSTMPWTYGLTFDIPIDLGGKRIAVQKQTEALGNIVRLELAAQAWRIRQSIRMQFLHLTTSAQALALLARQTRAQAKVVHFIQNRLNLGDATSPELELEESVLNREKLTSTKYQLVHDQALSQLANLLGLPVKAIQKIQFDFSQLNQNMQAPDAELQQQALLNRSDLQIALAQYDSKRAELQLEMARQYPDLSLGPAYSFDRGQNKYSFTPVLSNFPLFHNNSLNIQKAKASLAESKAHAEQVQQQAINNTEQANKAVVLARHGLSLAETAHMQQKQRLHSIKKQFEAGAVGGLEVALAERAYNESDLARLDVWIQYQTALANLENALQRPLQNHAFNQPETQSPRQQ